MAEYPKFNHTGPHITLSVPTFEVLYEVQPLYADEAAYSDSVLSAPKGKMHLKFHGTVYEKMTMEKNATYVTATLFHATGNKFTILPGKVVWTDPQGVSQDFVVPFNQKEVVFKVPAKKSILASLAEKPLSEIETSSVQYEVAPGEVHDWGGKSASELLKEINASELLKEINSWKKKKSQESYAQTDYAQGGYITSGSASNIKVNVNTTIDPPLYTYSLQGPTGETSPPAGLVPVHLKAGEQLVIIATEDSVVYLPESGTDHMAIPRCDPAPASPAKKKAVKKKLKSTPVKAAKFIEVEKPTLNNADLLDNEDF